jgi:UDP-4-amino-4,6-dideoxy-N-acetyl-beta-L-altrosamine transaminase
MKKSIPYGRQDITPDDIAIVVEALQHDYLTQGPHIDAFETAFGAYIGSKYAVAVANGTAALHLCALALDVNENTNVITAPITFVASANCVRYCGGTVTFADIDPETLTLDIQHVRQLLEQSPKGTYQGIIPIDFAGYPCDLEAFRKLADEFGLWIIEDSCHSPGGYFVDKSGEKQRCGNGNFADLAIFSFHPVKHIASGEGGMITTNDPVLYAKLLRLRTHGITKNPDEMTEFHGGWYHQMLDLGYNYRLTDFQAALGMSQLAKAEERMQRRQAIAQRYNEAFAGTCVQTHVPKDGIFHAYHLYVVELNNRKAVYEHLRAHQIFAQVHYIPVHTQPYYRSLETQTVVLPVAERYYERGLSLPMYPTLTDEEQEFVIEKVLEAAR